MLGVYALATYPWVGADSLIPEEVPAFERGFQNTQVCFGSISSQVTVWTENLRHGKRTCWDWSSTRVGYH